MKDKYNLSKKENVFLAKRNIVDYIWKSAKLEGINITLPETQAIFDKLKLQNVDISDVNTVLNLKHAWQFILKNLDDELNLDYICKINYEVSKDESLDWGVLRYGKVGISGTDYIPPIPTEQSFYEIIDSVSRYETITEKFITLMLKLMKAQLFWDGNKRTSMLVANKIMISNGKGVISIPNEHITEFNTLLNHYYSVDEIDPVKSFIYEKAISGMTIERKSNL
ncbi:Fic family protein [Anaerococcus sp. WCA-380-WT-2B]|uniref:Fic family protein n=1 Tax=Anaerococcus porci TaxID=2652269 RepID=A0A6N7VV84_9FIRM|nr:Fic family protein [Anaerococcus porci]MSS78812.1 Fic family protein [Anaerococcus porci]